MKKRACQVVASLFLPLLLLLLIQGDHTSGARIYSVPFDFGNQTFQLDHEVLHFSNGFYRDPTGQHTAYLIDHRINSARTRAAAILIDNPAGSGIFFYVIEAVRTDEKEVYTPPVFLGDRIRIEAVNVIGLVVTIRYLDHSAGVPLAVPPTKQVTATYLIQYDGSLRPV